MRLTRIYLFYMKHILEENYAKLSSKLKKINDFLNNVNNVLMFQQL
jgi:hypothetical protein